MRAGVAGFIALLIASPVPSAAETVQSFEAWLSDLKPAMTSAGVSDATFNRVFSGLSPDCGQTGVFCGVTPGEDNQQSWTERDGLPNSCDKVPQREFLEPAAYFPESFIRQIVAKGQAVLADLRTQQNDTYQHILKIEDVYGVPVPMLMALWARETSFGEARLDHNAVTALASLAYAGLEHRRAWNRRQLTGAVKMIEDGHVTVAAFRSSWAGATGLTQIMPEEFLQFGADGDGDGVKNIWTSVPDALATTANILKQRGWKTEQRGWGQEVRLPQGDTAWDCTLEGRGNRRPVGRWVEQSGIAPIQRGAQIAAPSLGMDQLGYLLTPAGTSGPAFLVTDNFDALRAYNPSDLYALFVGTIHDRLGCDTPDAACTFNAPWPDANPDAFAFTVENICRLQRGLQQKGLLGGEADGLFGPQTRIAIGRYQKSQGVTPTCYPTTPLFEHVTGSRKNDAPQQDGAPAVP